MSAKFYCEGCGRTSHDDDPLAAWCPLYRMYMYEYWKRWRRGSV